MNDSLLHSLQSQSGEDLPWPWQSLNNSLSSVLQSHKNPKITIITPSYNQGNYLEETILSVLRQNYSNYELIIIDGGSKDKTIDVIKKYEQWITYWVSEPDRGQSHAIQKGLAVATGDIINWINSDDLLAPGALHNISAEFDLTTHDVMCGYCHYFLGDLQHLDLQNERMGLSPTVGETFLKRKINQPSTFYKASIIKELGVQEQLHYAMDLDLWYRYLLRAGQDRVILSENLLSYFRLHESSKTVALYPRFEMDVQKVFTNVMHSLGQPDSLVAYMKREVSDESFVPMRYPVAIPVTEASSFIRLHAWEAMIHYNSNGDLQSAKECYAAARAHKQPFSGATLRQFIKHYLLPSGLIRR